MAVKLICSLNQKNLINELRGLNAFKLAFVIVSITHMDKLGSRTRREETKNRGMNWLLSSYATEFD